MNKYCWPKTPLKALSSQIGDGIHGTPEYVDDSDFAFINGNNLKNGFIEISSDTKKVSEKEYKKFLIDFDRNTLFLSINGTLGRLAKYRKEPIILGKSAAYIKCTNINIDFLYYYLQLEHVQKYMWNVATGSTIKNLSLDSVRNLLIPTPSDFIQKRIASVLSAFDNKIELNNRINAELEAMAKILYDYWFVQLDFPDPNGKPYKSSGGKMVYSPTLRREIPVGWDVKELSKVTYTSLGGTPATKNMEYWENSDIAWLSSAEIADFPVVDSEQRITQKGIENSAAVLLPRGSVVISIVRYIRPSILGIDAATNQSVVGILENKSFKKSFIYPFLCGEVPRLMGLRTGAQQPHINKGTIDETLIVVPADDVLEKYYKTAEPIFDLIITRAFETHHLTQLRDWLLPMLMNGQVTVA